LADFKIAVSGEGEFKNGLQMATNFNKVPGGMAIESMVKDGVKVESSYLNESEAPMQALVQGNVHFAQTAFTSAIAAIAKGAPAKIVAETRRPEYVMLTLKEMKAPADFNGRRVAIHSNVSSVAMMTRLFLKDVPQVKPDILVIPGSPNRIQAMLAGQVDASVVQLGDDDGILAQQPDKWHVTFNYAKEMPDLLDAVLVVRDDFLAQNRPTVVELVKRTLDANRKVNADEKFLVNAARQREVTLPKGASLENHAKRYVESAVFPNDGGVTEKALKFSIDAARDTNFITGDIALGKVADLTVLQEATK
jgi:ABC-type nitrate/sulfonate/bicarbonate transport system substrate-binding protein